MLSVRTLPALQRSPVLSAGPHVFVHVHMYLRARAFGPVAGGLKEDPLTHYGVAGRSFCTSNFAMGLALV